MFGRRGGQPFTLSTACIFPLPRMAGFGSEPGAPSNSQLPSSLEEAPNPAASLFWLSSHPTSPTRPSRLVRKDRKQKNETQKKTSDDYSAGRLADNSSKGSARTARHMKKKGASKWCGSTKDIFPPCSPICRSSGGLSRSSLLDQVVRIEGEQKPGIFAILHMFWLLRCMPSKP